MNSVLIYLAIRSWDDRSHMEDSLVLDHYDVSGFGTAAELWPRFQTKPARMIITDRRFDDGYCGLDLARNIRGQFPLPHVYIIMLSTLSSLNEIKDGLAAGVDDYLIKPYNPFQIRSRVLVGLRWLTHLDAVCPEPLVLKAV